METKTCTVCNIEKHINNFYKRFSECQDCNIKRGVKRYFNKKDKLSLSIQQNYTTKKIEIKYYRNKMNIETEQTQILKTYLDHILN